jgi:subtilisin family serine protease
MKASFNHKWITAGVVAMIFLSPSLLQGCDGITSANEPESSGVETNLTSKMRHAHLLPSTAGDGAGKVLDRYAELSTSTEFIMGFSTTVLNPQGVLDRYSQEPGVQIKKILKQSIYGFAVHIDANQLDRLLAIIEVDRDIAWMEPDIKFNMPSAGSFTPVQNRQILVSSLPYVGGDLTSTRPGDGSGTVNADIYILDTGIDHPDVSVVERVDFTAANAELDMTGVLDRYSEGMAAYSDGVGHGTHVAGIAAAIDDGDHVVGMAPGASLHDFKVLNDQGQGEMSSVISALDVIIARKILNPTKPYVVNLSLGADIGTTSYNALDYAVVKAVSKGVIVVIAAGNQTKNVSTITPAHVLEAITVGASTNSSTFALASFSNYGLGVDVYATGVNVYSLSPFDGYKFAVEMNGTSMAAPLVTGAIALFLSTNPSATVGEVMSTLQTATKLITVGKGKSAVTYRLLDARIL